MQKTKQRVTMACTSNYCLEQSLMAGFGTSTNGRFWGDHRGSVRPGERSFVKITERTYEKTAQALQLSKRRWPFYDAIFLDKTPVSDLCEELGLQPTVFYRWQKEFFENGASAFQARERPARQVEEKQKRIEFLERKVQTKDEVLAELKGRATSR